MFNATQDQRLIPVPCHGPRGGVKFDRVTASQARKFQENILRSILQLEKTFFDMAEEDQGNVLIVCDRGAMDPSACVCVCVCVSE